MNCTAHFSSAPSSSSASTTLKAPSASHFNRASGNKAGEMLVADLPDLLKEQQLFVGGPVQPTALSFLHTDSFIPDATVLPNLNLGHSLDTLPGNRRFVFSGAQGEALCGLRWLESRPVGERNETQSRLTHPASLDLIFDTRRRNSGNSCCAARRLAKPHPVPVAR